MFWKKIKIKKYKNIKQCLRSYEKKYYISLWIKDIFKNFKKINFDEKEVEIHKINLKNLGFKKPTTLKKVYEKFAMKGYKPLDPKIAIYIRDLYKEQKTGEWLRIAVPFNSMIDSDGVPHLPKLGSALGKLFIETYWSYPGAIFHPHNDFLVEKILKKKK